LRKYLTAFLAAAENHGKDGRHGNQARRLMTAVVESANPRPKHSLDSHDSRDSWLKTGNHESGECGE